LRNVKVLEAIYRKIICLAINFGQKTCSKEFYQPLMLVKTFEYVFLVVQTTVQNKLTQFGLHNPDNSHGFRIVYSEFVRYMAKLKEAAHILWVRDISDYTIWNMIFFHVVHIAPTIFVVLDAHGPL